MTYKVETKGKNRFIIALIEASVNDVLKSFHGRKEIIVSILNDEVIKIEVLFEFQANDKRGRISFTTDKRNELKFVEAVIVAATEFLKSIASSRKPQASSDKVASDKVTK